MGDWQIQIIFTYGNQYCAQIFVHTKCYLHACYIHGRNHAHNLWRPECMIFLISFKIKVCICSFGKKKKTGQSFSFQKRMFFLSSCFSDSTTDLIWKCDKSIYQITIIWKITFQQLQRSVIEALCDIIERHVKFSNKTWFYYKILTAFADNIGLINY